MRIILLERVKNLGFMGDVVGVKDGYARNFLLPKGKALRANKANLEEFKNRQKELEAVNLEQKKEAEAVAVKLKNFSVTVITNAGESGQLYGAVTSRTIADAMVEKGVKVAYHQIDIKTPIKAVGIREVNVTLHPEVEVMVLVNVASSNDQADLQMQERMEELNKKSSSNKKKTTVKTETAADAEVKAETETKTEEK